jgi:biotin carboxylase
MNKPERNNADDVLNALKNLYREHYKLEELIEQKAYSAMETCMDTVGLGILAIGKEKVLDRLRKSIADTKECKLTWAQIEEIARTALKMQVPATN